MYYQSSCSYESHYSGPWFFEKILNCELQAITTCRGQSPNPLLLYNALEFGAMYCESTILLPPILIAFPTHSPHYFFLGTTQILQNCYNLSFCLSKGPISKVYFHHYYLRCWMQWTSCHYMILFLYSSPQNQRTLHLQTYTLQNQKLIYKMLWHLSKVANVLNCFATFSTNPTVTNGCLLSKESIVY